MPLKIVRVSKSLVIIASFLIIAACVHEEQVRTDTMRVCDENGCTDRPKGYASFNPATALPAEDTAKITALEQLAAQDPRAAYDLSLRFFRGDGVRQDSYRSLKWMRDAAERGDLNAQKALGRLYLTGLGEMGADPGEAEKWLSITASRGDKEAATLLAEATEARKSAQAEYRWYTRWQPIFQNYWYSSYVYYFHDLRTKDDYPPTQQSQQARPMITAEQRPVPSSPPQASPTPPQASPTPPQASPTPPQTSPTVTAGQRSDTAGQRPDATGQRPDNAGQRPDTAGQRPDLLPPSSPPSSPGGEARTALVIGNASYLASPLRTPQNDARALHDALRNLGFNVTLIENGKRREIIAAIEAFGSTLRQKGGVGLVFYAGHGVQIKGKNYLLPVDAQVQSEVSAVAETVDVELVLGTMAEAGTRINVIILDACRNNPFEHRWRGTGRGLAPVTASDAKGTLIAYSTDPGKTAEDGDGEHSPYAKALIDVLRVPNLSIEQVFKHVRRQVQEVTAGAQTPWETSNLTGDFFFSLH